MPRGDEHPSAPLPMSAADTHPLDSLKIVEIKKLLTRANVPPARILEVRTKDELIALAIDHGIQDAFGVDQWTIERKRLEQDDATRRDRDLEQRKRVAQVKRARMRSKGLKVDSPRQQTTRRPVSAADAHMKLENKGPYQHGASVDFGDHIPSAVRQPHHALPDDHGTEPRAPMVTRACICTERQAIADQLNEIIPEGPSLEDLRAALIAGRQTGTRGHSQTTSEQRDWLGIWV
jgi:hypothetical protein